MPVNRHLMAPMWRSARHLPLWATTLLLVRYPHPPALDWPQHTAVAGILVALWREEPCVTAHYAFNLSPTPYHLLYAVLAPAIAVLGSRWGSVFTLILMAAWTHLGLQAWAKALGRPPWLCLFSPLMFFSASFAWGFGPTMMGLGPALFALAGYARLYHRPTGRGALVAGGWGALAVAAHGVFLPAMGLAAVPLLLRRNRSAIGAAAVGLAVLLVPALPLFAHLMLGHSGPHTTPELTFETPFTGWNHLRMYFAAFDRGLSRNVHQTLLVVAAIAAARRRRSWTRPEVEVLGVAMGHLLLLWLVPLNIALSPAPAWLLNARFLPLFVAAVLLIAIPVASTRTTIWQPIAAASMLAYLIGIAHVFARFDAASMTTAAWAAGLPDNTVLEASGAPQKFDQAWPPLARHLSCAWVPHPVCAHGNLFAGGHLPIRLRDPATVPANAQAAP